MKPALSIRLYVCGIALAFAVCVPVNAQDWSVTATGTIEASGTGLDNAGLFGAAGSSLVGDTYTETITTNPLLNSTTACASATCAGTIGGLNNPAYDPGAAYTLTTTINGDSFKLTETTPFLNYAYLIDALSKHDTSTTLQDQVFQGTQSSGCASPSGTCVSSYILAYSLTNPFVMNFNHAINASGGLDPGSNTYFAWVENNGTPSGLTTIFYGSINTLSVRPMGGNPGGQSSVNGVPEPSTFSLLAIALIGVAIGCISRRTHARE
jgi:hypothetical protein